jgi:hypothetical protein
MPNGWYLMKSFHEVCKLYAEDSTAGVYISSDRLEPALLELPARSASNNAALLRLCFRLWGVSFNVYWLCWDICHPNGIRGCWCLRAIVIQLPIGTSPVHGEV